MRESVYYVYYIFKIIIRIEEIENFYENNIGDFRIYNFEKARIKLKKLLMYDPDVIYRVENRKKFDLKEIINNKS